MTKWAADKVERKRVNKLIPYERNPKIHSDSQINQLANSITQWGWTIPILVDEKDMVIAGHGRLYAAQQLGIKEVPTMVAKGWTEEQKRSYVIADNKLAENSEWDIGLYFSELKELSDNEFDLSLMGVDIDLSSFNYTPKLEPDFQASTIDEDSMLSAQEKMTADHKNRISGVNQVNVICPHCGEEFTYSGN
jgi:ParB-like chromosome segregation protein Spo0J